MSGVDSVCTDLVSVGPVIPLHRTALACARSKNYCTYTSHYIFHNSYTNYVVYTRSSSCVVDFCVDYIEALQHNTAAFRAVFIAVRRSTATIYI